MKKLLIRAWHGVNGTRGVKSNGVTPGALPVRRSYGTRRHHPIVVTGNQTGSSIRSGPFPLKRKECRSNLLFPAAFPALLRR